MGSAGSVGGLAWPSGTALGAPSPVMAGSAGTTNSLDGGAGAASAIADFEGGRLTGFGHAYLALGLSMLVMLLIAFGLKRKSTESVAGPTSSVGT